MLDGVTSVVVGYTGGTTPFPTYENIGDHTEAVRIEFDPSVISYYDILEHMMGQHSPTSMQSTQYRSAIFVHSAEQKMVAEEIKHLMARHLRKPIFTDIEKAGPFYRAEEYHQK